MKEKILYLVTQSEFGGAQIYISALALNLDKEKYMVEVAVGQPATEPWLQKLKNNNIKVWHLKHVVRQLSLWHDLLSGWELFFLFLRTKPDIIHLNSSKVGSTGSVIGWIYKKILHKKLKIIYTAHGFVFQEPMAAWRRLYYLWSEKIASQFRDKIICVSENDKTLGLNKKIARHDKFVIVHNGIDLKNLNFLPPQEARQKLAPLISTNDNTNQQKFWCGTIANLYPAKGLEDLILAAEKITAKNKNIIFVVIGEGQERNKLENLTKKYHLENNFFLVGSLNQAATYLKAFDLFILSSVKEGLPYTLIETLAAGLPIIATTVGGNPEIVENNINGLLVAPRQPDEIATAIKKIILNPALAEKFKTNNLEKVKQFEMQNMLAETQKIYNQNN